MTTKKTDASDQSIAPVAPFTPPAAEAAAEPAETVSADPAKPGTPGAGERLLLPSGNWMDVRDPHTVKRSEKRGMLAEAVDAEDSEVVSSLKTQDGLIALLTVGWSFDAPLPRVDVDSLDVLDPADDAVVDAWVKRAWAVMSPRPITPDDHKDPTSPTAPSAG